jgi:hypothetical protein
MRRTVKAWTVGVALTALWTAGAALGQAVDDPTTIEPIPPLQTTYDGTQADEFEARAQLREYARQVRELRAKHFRTRNDRIRLQGIEQIAEFTDSASFMPLFDELKDEKDDVRAALLNHYQSQGEWGQAALAWIVLHSRDEALHYEAYKRLSSPASDATISVIDQGLRSDNDFVANMAGRLAGHFDLYEAIPLLIQGQSREGRVMTSADQAWILVGQQKVFIRALIPIIGDNSGAFLPVPGVLTEGVILRVTEAVAVIYRTEIHQTLVAMSTKRFGTPTDDFGYDRTRWARWYEQEYLPREREREAIERVAAERHTRTPEDQPATRDDDRDDGGE